MDEKHLNTLELPKILDRLAGYTAFSASAELARALRPTPELDEAVLRQKRTTEARGLLDLSADVSVGGSHDVRPQADLAAHGGVLTPTDLLDIRTTLVAARTIARTFERQSSQFPALGEIAALLPPPPGLVDTISRAISERGEIMDSASPRLGSIRRAVKVAHDRLQAKLQRLVDDPKTASMLQEGIITQRGGRYVIPLKAEFKGQMRSVVHDQSSSGATLFVEPLAVVELNNEWRELQLAERDEERRILAELSGQVGVHAAHIAQVVGALAELDLSLACAKYAEELHAFEPVLLPFRPAKSSGAAQDLRDSRHPGSVMRLYQARHPLLEPSTVVPIDLVLDDATYALVITGPNTGGKTVTLKTAGLLVLMAQCGLHIPAQSGSEMSVFRSVFADIGDEQSIEQSLSTFSAHITNIIKILHRIDRYSLVLLDELGAGTDPQEGSALARAILTHLLEKRATSLVATHYPELKAFAHATPGVVNASVEFDLKTLRPTYHLTIGLPGRSNALAIAERLGLPGEIIELARGEIHPDELRTEDLLDEIHRQREQARKARGAAEDKLREAETKRAQLAARLANLEDERHAVLEEARLQAEEQVSDLQRELEEVRKALAKARQPLDALKPVNEQVQALVESIQEPVEPQDRLPGVSLGPLKLGEKVRLRSLKMEGVVTGLGEEEVEVQVGVLRLRARLEDLQRNESRETRAENREQRTENRLKGDKESPAGKRNATRRTLADGPGHTSSAPLRSSPGMELDLRGQTAEDALPILERHIESAYLAGLPFVRIIHGKGTGRLRIAVRDALRRLPHVSKAEPGQENEGGDGVTIARIVQE